MNHHSLKVKAARDLGPQFKDNPHRMTGQDGAYPIRLNGETLWFFGDTLIGERVPCESVWYPGGVPVGPTDMSGKASIERMLNNTALIARDKTGKNGIKDYEYIMDEDGQLKQLLPLLPGEHHDEVRIWCLHGCKIKDKLYLYFIKVNMIEGDVLPVNFEIVGSGLACGSMDDWEFTRIKHNDSDILWTPDLPYFGSSVFPAVEDGLVYVYGIKIINGVQSCFIARVGCDDITDLEQYEYLVSDKPEWSPDLEKAVIIFRRMPNEMSVSYNDYLGCFLAVHSLDMTGKIVGRTAPNPWGPWSEPVLLWTVTPHYDIELQYPPQIYAGKEHPELADDGGRVIYLTYIEFEEYLPHLVEVTLE